MNAGPRRRLRNAILLTLVAVLLAELLAFLLPEDAQPFHRAGFLLVLAAVIAAAWTSGLKGGLIAAAIGAAGIIHLFLVYGGPLGPAPIRITVGGTIAGFGVALAGLIGYMRDREARALAKEHEISTTLLAANRSLTEANEALEAFAYVVSHDLKEPVRAMEALLGAFVEDHGDDERIPAEARGLVKNAREANARLTRLLLSLLDLSRAARIDPRELRMVPLADTARSEECRTRYENVVGERGARIHIDIPPGVAVVAHQEGMCQILGNLIGNAVRHNPRDNPQVRIAAEVHGPDGVVDISVEDDGDGFPPAVVETFERGGLPASTRGSGFGLTIARRAVEKMGGTISLGRSQTLGGGAVHIRLPMEVRPKEAPVEPGP